MLYTVLYNSLVCVCACVDSNKNMGFTVLTHTYLSETWATTNPVSIICVCKEKVKFQPWERKSCNVGQL